MTSQIPEFGLASAQNQYVLRPGGYAVIFNSAGEVALVRAPGGVFLPGGGQQEAETPEEAALRETLEECGLRISLCGCIGVGDELVFAADEGIYYRKRCTFFLAESIENLGNGESDHELIWLPPERAVAELWHESQRWAVAAACRQTFDR